MNFDKPDPFQQTIARTFSYATSSFLLGAMFYLFTSNLIVLTFRPDWIGTAVLIGYGFIFGNITYLMTRRYLRRPFTFDWFSYLIGLLVVTPTIVLIRLKGNVFPSFQDEAIYLVVILCGVAVGCWKGREKGARILKESQETQTVNQQNSPA